MTATNPFRKVAILITALDPTSADQLLEQMSADQAERIRHAVFELDDIDPAEQQQILSEFLQSTGRGDQAVTAEPRSEEHVELELSTAASELAQTRPSVVPAPVVAEPEVRATVETYREPTASQAATPDAPPFAFLSEIGAKQLAAFLEREHPQTIAVVTAHLPAQQAAELVGELETMLQAEVLRRVADLASADPLALEVIEEELRRLFHAEEAQGSNEPAGLTTLSSILAAAGDSREQLVANIKQYAPGLGSRLGQIAEGNASASFAAESHDWSQSLEFTAAEPSQALLDLEQEIEAHRRLAHSTRSGSLAIPSPDPSIINDALEDSAETPTPSHAGPTVAWEFSDLNELSDIDLARVLQAAQSELTMVALAGADPSFVARLTKQLSPAMARQFSHRIETVGPLKLRDIEAAQKQIAHMAAELAEQGEIKQKAARPFAMAA